MPVYKDDNNGTFIILFQCISKKCALIKDSRSDDKRTTDRNGDFTSRRSRLRSNLQTKPPATILSAISPVYPV